MPEHAMVTLSRLGAAELMAEVADRADDIKAQLCDLNGRLTEIAETYEWGSFSPDQRARLSTLHNVIRRSADLLSPHV